MRQGLTGSQYSIIPEQPLTCISYGTILPGNDTEWQETVNNFIRDRSSTNWLEKVLGPNSPFLPMSVADQNKCIRSGARVRCALRALLLDVQEQVS